MSKKVEIEEAELARLINGSKLLQQLNGNPDGRKHLERGLKVLNPQLETEEDVAARLAAPHLEEVRGVKSEVEALRKQLADEKTARETAEEEARTNRALGWLDSQNYTDEGKDQIKRIMLDEKVANVEAAAALFEKRTPKPVVVAGANYEADSWDLRGDPEDKNLKALFENEDKWADREAAMVLNTMRAEAAKQAAA